MNHRQSGVNQVSDTVKRLTDFIVGDRLSLGRWLIRFDLIFQWVKQFKPDVIYARPIDTPNFYWWLPYKLSKALDIPYVVHIMDDWPARYKERSGLLDIFFRKPALRKHLNLLLSNSSLNLGISEEMCHAFQERYQCRFIHFHNCIDISDFEGKKISYEVENTFEIVYTGSVTEDKELASLIDIKNAILGLHQKDVSVKFTIYGPEIYRSTIEKRLVVPNVVTYGGFFPPENKPDILTRADLLVLPLNFDAQSLTYTQYSFQTKLPEYMASGTPMLLYGPSSSPNIRYASRSNFGFVVQERNTTQLQDMLIQIVQNQTLREMHGKRAQKIAFLEHDAAVVRTKFHRVLSEITDVSNNPPL